MTGSPLTRLIGKRPQSTCGSTPSTTTRRRKSGPSSRRAAVFVVTGFFAAARLAIRVVNQQSAMSVDPHRSPVVDAAEILLAAVQLQHGHRARQQFVAAACTQA